MIEKHAVFAFSALLAPPVQCIPVTAQPDAPPDAPTSSVSNLPKGQQDS